MTDESFKADKLVTLSNGLLIFSISWFYSHVTTNEHVIQWFWIDGYFVMNEDE